MNRKYVEVKLIETSDKVTTLLIVLFCNSSFEKNDNPIHVYYNKIIINDTFCTILLLSFYLILSSRLKRRQKKKRRVQKVTFRVSSIYFVTWKVDHLPTFSPIRLIGARFFYGAVISLRIWPLHCNIFFMFLSSFFYNLWSFFSQKN